MIFKLILSYALARGVAKAVVDPRGTDIADVLAWLRTIFPPPYRVREITEAEFRRIHGWPDVICHELTYGLELCERPATTVVEHADGEYLTYCTEHAEGCWAHRPQRALAAEFVFESATTEGDT